MHVLNTVSKTYHSKICKLTLIFPLLHVLFCCRYNYSHTDHTQVLHYWKEIYFFIKAVKAAFLNTWSNPSWYSNKSFHWFIEILQHNNIMKKKKKRNHKGKKSTFSSSGLLLPQPGTEFQTVCTDLRHLQCGKPWEHPSTTTTNKKFE